MTIESKERKLPVGAFWEKGMRHRADPLRRALTATEEKMMAKIRRIHKITDEKFLNMYILEGEKKTGAPMRYQLASRARSVEDLKMKSQKADADAVIIYALYAGEDAFDSKEEAACQNLRRSPDLRVVMVRQYRAAVDDFVYELPAGLVDPGETMRQAAVRETFEETGLKLEILDVDPIFERARFTTIGMTDENNGIVYGYACGLPSNANEEDSEEIEVILADRDRVREILAKGKVSMPTAYQLMHFLGEGDPFAFLE